MNPSEELESIICLCGNSTDKTIIEAVDPVERRVWVYRCCPECGLERLSPRPKITEMGRYYPDEYTPYNDPAPQQESRADQIKKLVYETYFASSEERSLFVRRYRILLMVILLPFRQHSVLSFKPPDLPRRVFEFGASSGADLLEFRSAGWHVSGCEPSSFVAATAAARGVELQVCAAEDAILPDNLSCAYMNNVFEHLHDPIAVLAKIHTALLPGGLVVIVVPNHASWAARMFGSQWPGYDPPRHIWGFTPHSVQGVFARAGFETVSVVQKYPLSTFCWGTGLTAGRTVDGKDNVWGRRIVRLLGRGLLLGGFMAALFGSGDFMRVVARKVG